MMRMIIVILMCMIVQVNVMEMPLSRIIGGMVMEMNWDLVTIPKVIVLHWFRMDGCLIILMMMTIVFLITMIVWECVMVMIMF